MPFFSFTHPISKQPTTSLDRIGPSEHDNKNMPSSFKRFVSQWMMSIRPTRRNAHLVLILTGLFVGMDGVGRPLASQKASLFRIQAAKAQTVPTGTSCPAFGGTIGLNQITNEFGGSFGTLNSGYRDLTTSPTGYTYSTNPSLLGGFGNLDNGANGIITVDRLGYLYNAATYVVTSQPGSGQNLNVFGPWRSQTGLIHSWFPVRR